MSFFGLVVVAGVFCVFFLLRPHVALGAADSCHDVDLNGDGVVNIIDLVTIARSFGVRFSPGTYSPNAYWDVSEDGIVNIIDLVAVARYFGESCEVLAAPAQISSADSPGKVRRAGGGEAGSSNDDLGLRRLLNDLFFSYYDVDEFRARVLPPLDLDKQRLAELKERVLDIGEPAIELIVRDYLCSSLDEVGGDPRFRRSYEMLYRFGNNALPFLRRGLMVSGYVRESDSRVDCQSVISRLIRAIEGAGKAQDVPDVIWLEDALSRSRQPIPVYEGGGSSEPIDFLFFSESHPGGLEMFLRDVRRMTREMVEEDNIFKTYAPYINVYARGVETPVFLKEGEECLNPLQALFAPQELTGRVFCADPEIVRRVNQISGTDIPIIIAYSHYGGTAFINYQELNLGLFWFLMNTFDFNREFGYTVVGGPESDVVIHELGHLMGLLPDYYVSDPNCVLHHSRMCNSGYQFSDEGLSYDKAKMVKFFNQYVEGRVTSVSTPYPNPFSRASGGTVRINYTVSYPSGAEPVFVLLEVYDAAGKLIDYKASDEPVAAGSHTFLWDAKNLDLERVASGIYFYKISIHDGLISRGVVADAGGGSFLGQLVRAVTGVFFPMFR